MSPRYNLQRIRADATYTAKELAVTLEINIGTVRKWKKHGLPLIDDGVPHLFEGAFVKAFLRSRAAPRQLLRNGEIFCVACRKPRIPVRGTIGFNALSSGVADFSGRCPVCRRRIHRRMKLADFPQVIQAAEVAPENEPATILGRELINGIPILAKA